MIDEFKTGKYYRCIVKERGTEWNREGEMDFILDGKPRLCIDGAGNLARFQGDGRLWRWKLDEFEECGNWEKELERFKKNEY